ncbi:MGH1-like glycoside hydrolase domain-containing protein [Fodinibius salsisoli]|uniref:Mannosylglycerate hydrolase MGH1-like glycoside hydrolase domain-containing protein n=1 Tax=Fodinibius salsisoli TaxID=2820877 RepID=A0ABT3PK51_9BACT|nr:trehalase family glycosidase [Fodinibius salsisoli]MCW9706225.1 hypothetical protein [Fodinibius salsisoli]
MKSFDIFERQIDIKSLINEAKRILDQNWMNGFTRPARKMYPHQWSWDSAFMAIGYATYRQERAEEELQRLFSGQWSNGMVPHIIFNDNDKESDYFPGSDFWQTEHLSQSPNTVSTSGICQPPIHATAIRHLLETAHDRRQAQSFAKDVFPSLKAWHSFLYRERDPNDEGLVYIRHPWSSGQDNSPNWDHILQQINLSQEQIPSYERTDNKHNDSSERPSNRSYDRYIYLVDFFRKRGYNEDKIRRDGCPFLVQDVLFNTLLCRAGRDLAQIAEWLGKDPSPFYKQAKKTAKSINKNMWDKNHNIYVDLDWRNGEKIDVYMLSGFLPLFANVPSPARSEQMFSYLNTQSFCQLKKNCLAVPSYDRQQPKYSDQKYWRGPIWINLNWLLYKGLAQYGHREYDKLIKQTIIYLVQKSGFHEFYNPKTGEGYGAEKFSWTAALFLDILNSERTVTF